MKIMLGDFFPKETSYEYKTGSLYTLKVLEFYKKTKYLFSRKSKHVDKNKKRPIIILSYNNGKIYIVGFTTFELSQKEVFKISTKSCDRAEDCAWIKDEVWLFHKPTQSGKLRFRYEISIVDFEECIKEHIVSYCGKCKSELVKDIESKINNTGNAL